MEPVWLQDWALSTVLHFPAKKKKISRGLAVVKEKEDLSKRPIKASSQVTCQPQEDQAQGEAEATNRK